MIAIGAAKLKCRLRMVTMHSADWRGRSRNHNMPSDGGRILFTSDKFAWSVPLM